MAADLDLKDKPFYVLTVGTSAVKKILLPASADVTIAALGIQDDAGTANAASDKVVGMHAVDTMVADNTDGEKFILWTYGGGSNIALRGITIKTGSNGSHELQLKAVGNAAKVQFVVVLH